MKKTEIELETGHSNEWRAKNAYAALKTYAKRVKDDDLDNTIGDLISDLYHLASQTGRDPFSIEAVARNHYEYESELGKEAA